MPYRDPAAKKLWNRNWYLKNKERHKSKQIARIASLSEQEKEERRAKCSEYTRNYRREHGRKDRPSYSDAERLHRSKSVQRWLESPRLSPSIAELVNKAEQRYEVEMQKREYRLMYNREKSKRRKARLKGNVLIQIKPYAIRSRYAEFDNCCAYCGKQHKAMDLEIEHFVPISKGGTHVLSNIVPACKSCNSSKTYHDAKAWYEKQEFYSRKRWLKIIDVLGKRKMHAGQLSFV